MAGIGSVNKVTERQKAILRLLLNGNDAKSAARELAISVHTVNEHLREARRSLGISSSREAARLLRDAEDGTPNSMRPTTFGVDPPIGQRFRFGNATPKVWVVSAGVALMIRSSRCGRYSLARKRSGLRPPACDIQDDASRGRFDSRRSGRSQMALRVRSTGMGRVLA